MCFNKTKLVFFLFIWSGFPSDNFPKIAISQAATFQRLGVLGCRRLQGGVPTLQQGQTWEVTAWEIAHLGSYCLGNCTFGKVPNIIWLPHSFARCTPGIVNNKFNYSYPVQLILFVQFRPQNSCLGSQGTVPEGLKAPGGLEQVYGTGEES